MKIAIVCCSLNPDSRSAVLAEQLRDPLAAADTEIDWVDLRDHPLPLCDGGAAYGDPVVSALAARLADADALLLAVPIYNFAVNAAAKNLVELTGRGWAGKVVGVACSAGGRGSYMSAMGLAGSLMLDFRCWVVPRFVYADDGDFPDAERPRAVTPALRDRLHDLARDTARAAAALAPAAR
mgnify:CR=1 FL=1